MSYVVFKHAKEYGARKGLEGPFHYPNGQVLYYDPKEGQYYCPSSDFYVEQEEMDIINNRLMDVLRG